MLSDVLVESLEAGVEIELQCGSVIETEGNSVPSVAKFHQALHAIYIPHKPCEAASLPSEFPSHLYKEPAEFLSRTEGENNLWEINFDARNYANEYDPCFFPSAFPTLFPYGVGGFQDPDRLQHFPMDKHIKFLLLQHHELYARHEIFMFVAYNVIQLDRSVAAADSSLIDPCCLRSVNFFVTLTTKVFRKR